MSPSVSRTPSEPKIRPYIKQSIVNSARRHFPLYEGTDADFIEWILESIIAGVLTFGNQAQAEAKDSPIAPERAAVETAQAEKVDSSKIDLLDELDGDI